MRRAYPLLRGIALGAAVILLAGLIARQTRLVDKRFIFFPERELAGTPADRGVAYEDVEFSAADGTALHGWLVPGDGSVTWLWLHGNAGNISHRLDNIAALHSRLGVGVFIFDYRGYGRSQGSPSENGAYLDAEAALAYLHAREDIDRNRIVFFGRSLGCAVAVDLATRHDPMAVVLESPFTSIRAMARRIYPFLPLGPLVTSRFDSLSKIGGVSAPVMVLHGDRDGTIPIDEGRLLFEAANEPKRFYTIEGADHNDTYVVGGEAYYRALADFMAELDN